VLKSANGRTLNVEMKILHIINTLGKGGAEKLLVQTLPAYNKEDGWEVTLLQITSRNVVPEYTEELKAAGVTIHTLGEKSVYDPSNILLLRRFLRKYNYDVIHVHIFPAMYWVPLAMTFKNNKAKLVFTEHNTYNRRWDKWYFKAADKYIYHKYEAIVAITDDVKKNLSQWQPGIKNRIQTIFNGINIASFKDVKAADRASLLSSLSIPENAALLMMTARFDKQKNHKAIIESMAILPENYYLLLAGDGPERGNMEALATSLDVAGRVKFLGFRADVLSLMKSTDVNILSSNYEGLSGVTLESLCSGKPFLGSDVTGIQNVVPDQRFLFENNNTAQLAQKIKQIVSDPSLATAMSVTGQEFVKDFDINKMVAKHIALYNSLHKN
jgi:glycosyltransferase involved in cell wall biosynthesis